MKQDATAEMAEVMEIDPREEANQPGSDSQADKQPAGSDKIDPAHKETLRALKETRQALQQVSKTAQFWMDKAQAAPRATKSEPEEEPTTSVDLVEAITAGDTKAIAKAMKELGFVSEKEVEARLNASSRISRSEQQLYKDFPDLQDEDSELFTETAKIYNRLAQRDPALAKSGELARIAAEMADTKLNGAAQEKPARRGSRRPAAEVDDFDEELDDDQEEERIERVSRQSAPRRRSGSSRREAPGSEELDATQKSIVNKLRAAGADITEDGYRKRALSGVRMAGMPTRRPRY